MDIRFVALDTDAVAALRAGGPDAYGMAPELAVSDGDGVPCRHCLGHVGRGEDYLVVAFRPFGALQPYAETGPIFLHAGPCPRAEGTANLPPMLDSPDYILRGYGHDDRIVYGTGAVVPTGDIPARARHLLGRADVSYLHVRSARNNCYQCRIEPA